ncbi:MAG: ribosomal-protein-alanine N-acetyltransferase [Alphaproteobacteria bacterium TMED93]|nr:MAG: ribosomal-protein-alanine N-acetyltransferase [Alphaproteobacteria bacterium TMED93]|tara:strand:- start:1854 stop:2288 length:435 start_codon:yes stop_codon:yes gene_type:complete
MRKKNRIEKIYKEYLSVKENNLNKWSESFFLKLFLDKNIFFVSLNRPLDGYLIARKTLDEYEVLTLATDINKRRRGIGTLLLTKLINLAKKDKVFRIILEVSENNIAAVSMYQKLGFKKISKRKNYYNNSEGFSDAHIMEKSFS